MRSRHLFGLLLSTLTIMGASSMGAGCTVITLFAPDGETQLAQNDDMSGSNDSELLYLVPEDGTYCLEVSECGVIFGEEVCAPADGITKPEYSVTAFELDLEAPYFTVDDEPNDTPAQATPVKKTPFPSSMP